MRTIASSFPKSVQRAHVYDTEYNESRRTTNRTAFSICCIYTVCHSISSSDLFTSGASRRECRVITRPRMKTGSSPARQQTFLHAYTSTVRCVCTIVGCLCVSIKKKRTIMIARGWRIRNRCREGRHLTLWRSITTQHYGWRRKGNEKKDSNVFFFIDFNSLVRKPLS